ncbi:MAG: IS110 family transposase [Alphaproteobacteria bacterium]
MPKTYDTRKSPVALDQDSTLIAVIEMSEASWLVAGIVPGIERQPLKKLAPDVDAVIRLLERWRAAGVRAGRVITRLVVAYESGRDGFWLARHLREHGIEVHVIHAASVAVARTHRRAKSDRLDTNMLKRAFVGWLRGEPDHCTMAPVPTRDAEDARRPSREREKLIGERTRLVNRMKAALARFGVRNFNPKLKKAPERLADVRMPDGRPLPPHTMTELKRAMTRARLLGDQIKELEADRVARLNEAPEAGTHPMVLMLARINGIGIETADMLVHEALSRNLGDRRAVARYGGLTGAPDESGKRRREKGLARAGNARVRRGMIQLAWRFLRFQGDSALAQWYQARCEGATRGRRKALIVALARKLLIALWRLVTTGETPHGVVLRPAV